MSAEGAALVRPRTTGELLDDAWRLYFADAPALLLLSGMFLVPAFAALVLLAGLPAPTNPILRLLPPLLPLPLLMLSGVGSGACQEWLRARAEGRKPAVLGSLAATFRRGLSHAAARTVALIGPLFGLGAAVSLLPLAFKPDGSVEPLLLWYLFLIAVAWLPALLAWPIMVCIHAFLASGKTRSLADLGDYFRQMRYDTTKSGVVTLSRLAMLVLVAVNLHLLVDLGLWVLDGLAGLDATFVAQQLTVADPVYILALALVSWLLLAPFFETSNFLMHVDARTRQEGLDLQVRVQNAFHTLDRQRVGALVVMVGLLWFASGASGADSPYDAVHAARLDVERIAQEAKTADPYSGAHFQVELDQTASRLESAGGGDRFAWFAKAIDHFDRRPKDDALRVLAEVDDRLALLEDTVPREESGKAPSKDDLKRLLQQPGANRPKVDVQPEEDADKPKEQKRPDQDDQDQQDDQGNRPHTALMGPGALPGGCGQVGLMLLGGLALAVLAVGAVMYFTSRGKAPRGPQKPLVPAKNVQQTTERRDGLPIDRPAAELFREADEQARGEQHLQAVRTLYLAVLSLLHRRQLLRFEPTRTNGEYIQQVRLAPQAPPALHAAFQDFTTLFDRKWYGDRACDAAEYGIARRTAEEIQGLVREL